VQIEAVGSTLEEAKRNAFRQAIEQTVGIVMLDEKEASGSILTKDFVGGYSAGYIDDFEILENYQDENKDLSCKSYAVFQIRLGLGKSHHLFQ
jgi:hypothetical protein